MMSNIFSYPYLLSACLLWWGIYSDFFAHILLELLVYLLNLKSFKKTILDTDPFSDMCFVNIFFWSEAFIFILLTVSFTQHKFICLSDVNLTRFSFMDYAFVVISKKIITILPYPRLSRLSHILSSKCFIVSHLTFRPLIHWELIFVKGLGSV